MIEMHLRILPGIDDGPETMEGSLALARALVQEGVHNDTMVPHSNDGFHHSTGGEIQHRVSDVQQELDHCCILLRLFAGHKALIKPGLVEDIQAGRRATLNGSRYLWLELWNSTRLPETERVMFELMFFGIISIIDHPESCRAILKRSGRLLAMLEQVVLTQLRVGTLLGMQDITTRKCIETLLKKEYFHFIVLPLMRISCTSVYLSGATYGLKCAVMLIDQALVELFIETYLAAIINDKTTFYSCTIYSEKL
jgi:protein-tyrosine phosphatase